MFYRDGSLISQGFPMRTERLTKCFIPLNKLRARLGFSSNWFKPLVNLNNCSKAVLLMWFSIVLDLVSASVLVSPSR